MRPTRLVDPAAARAVAAAYAEATTRRDPLTRAAYDRLVAESDGLLWRITDPDRPGAVRVRFTDCPDPYRSAGELIASVTDDGLLELATVAADRERRHPLMDSTRGGAYDRFRAVHDILGHAGLDLGFDRHGEFAVWLHQEGFHSPLARRALATELHGQHSVYWTTGRMAEPKAVLLAPALLRRSRRGAAAHEPGAGGGQGTCRSEQSDRTLLGAVGAGVEPRSV
ncbi:MAG TPA: hypothetical protein VKB57_01735 [Acidimicrobiales bacterium]|nr:hypothetical protein [Acidimicrobiales bacterium]